MARDMYLIACTDCHYADHPADVHKNIRILVNTDPSLHYLHIFLTQTVKTDQSAGTLRLS